MHNHSALTLLLSVSLILSPSVAGKSNANGKVFDLLLGLYKLNPLKGSPVYQSFSKNLLLGQRHKNSDDLNYKSSESAKEVQTHLNEIEKMIHTRNTNPVKHLEQPAYDLDDVAAEDFKADLVVNNRILSKEDLKTNLQYNLMKEDFSALFEHIGSNENNNETNVTKLLPVNDTVIQNLQMPNQNDTLSELTDKDKSSNHIDTLLEFRDENPLENPMDNLVGGTEDVFTF